MNALFLNPYLGLRVFLCSFVLHSIVYWLEKGGRSRSTPFFYALKKIFSLFLLKYLQL